MDLEKQEEIIYPSIIFRLKGSLYCVNSRYIATIMQIPQYENVPESEPYLLGLFPYRGEIVQMLDLRTFFGMQSLNVEYEQFEQMLEMRKQDHIHWVEELDRCMNEGIPFPLATDPHKCAFGRWYDSFTSENNEVVFHLKKIDTPHKQLHQAAVEATKCSQRCDSCERNECLKSILKKAREDYMPKILHLLEEAKEIFKGTIYHEMTLVLFDQPLALVVDEVLAVEDLPSPVPLSSKSSQGESCLTGITHSEKIEGEILTLDIPALMKTLGVGQP